MLPVFFFWPPPCIHLPSFTTSHPAPNPPLLDPSIQCSSRICFWSILLVSHFDGFVGSSAAAAASPERREPGACSIFALVL